MKIILATGQYPPVVSGIAKFSSALAARLESSGHRVDVITEGSGCRRVARVAFLDRLGKAKLREGADILQIIGPTPFFTEECAIYGKRVGITTVFRLDSLPGLQTFYRNPISVLLDEMYSRVWFRLALGRVDRAVFSTQDLAQNYPSYFGPYEVIPSGLDECPCPSSRLNAGQDREMVVGHSSRRTVAVLFVGQLRPYKGVRFLLHALQDLTRVGELDFRLTIVGDGPDGPSLRALATALGLRNYVEFRGLLGTSELHEAYRTHDVLVLPSTCAESFGLVLLEARRHGMAVVATDLPGTREVAKLLGGEVVPPADSSSMASAILRAVETAGAGADALPSLAAFSWDDIAQRYLEMYDKLRLSTSHRRASRNSTYTVRPNPRPSRGAQLRPGARSPPNQFGRSP